MATEVQMVAGRELDAIVAEHVMGWREVRKEYPVHADLDWWGIRPNDDPVSYYFGDTWVRRGYEFISRVPPYSAYIDAAWPLVEKLRLSVIPCDGRWLVVRFTEGEISEYETWLLVEEAFHDKDYDYTFAETAPLAICLAALKQVGYHGD